MTSEPSDRGEALATGAASTIFGTQESMTAVAVLPGAVPFPRASVMKRPAAGYADLLPGDGCGQLGLAAGPILGNHGLVQTVQRRVDLIAPGF